MMRRKTHWLIELVSSNRIDVSKKDQIEERMCYQCVPMCEAPSLKARRMLKKATSTSSSSSSKELYTKELTSDKSSSDKFTRDSLFCIKFSHIFA